MGSRIHPDMQAEDVVDMLMWCARLTLESTKVYMYGRDRVYMAADNVVLPFHHAHLIAQVSRG